MSLRVALLSRAVHPYHGFGGLERHVASLAKYLEREGCEVVIYTTPPASSFDGDRSDPRLRIVQPYRTLPWPDAKGFRVLDRNTNYLVWSLLAARELLAADGRHDIVQADGAAGFGYARRRGSGSPPLVLHPHGMEEFEAPPWKRLAYAPLRSAVRATAKRAARVVAPDASMRERVERNLGAPPERIVVLPNALDLEDIDAFARESSEEAFSTLETGTFVLLSVGRLEANKGFGVLAKALASGKERLPPRWVWLLVGSGPERARMGRWIESLGLRPNVRLSGGVSDRELQAFYRRADLFVHPTLYEGSSLVTLEAMAHSKAIVATRVGGIPDKIESGHSGLLVPPGDADALAEAIVAAAASGRSAMRKEWGQRARARVEERFSWAVRGREVVALYETVLRERRDGRDEEGE